MALGRFCLALVPLAAVSCGRGEVRVVVDEASGVVVERTGWRGWRRHGVWELNYADGSPEVRGRFDDGRRAGEWTWYHPGGVPRRRGRFRDTLAEGRWTEWHPNGTVRTEGLYERGDRVGKWPSWGADGRPAETYEWDAGTLVRIGPPDAAAGN